MPAIRTAVVCKLPPELNSYTQSLELGCTSYDHTPASLSNAQISCRPRASHSGTPSQHMRKKGSRSKQHPAVSILALYTSPAVSRVNVLSLCVPSVRSACDKVSPVPATACQLPATPITLACSVSLCCPVLCRCSSHHPFRILRRRLCNAQHL